MGPQDPMNLEGENHHLMMHHESTAPLGLCSAWDVKHWDQAPGAVHQEATAPPLGCRACSAGFRGWALGTGLKHCTAEGSALLCIAHTPNNALHVHHACTRENSNFQFWFFEFCQPLGGARKSEKMPRKGYPLRDEITGVCYGKVWLKCSIFSCFLSFFVKNG